WAVLRGAGPCGRGAGRLRARVRRGHQLQGCRRTTGAALTIGSARVRLGAALTHINVRESMLRTALPKLVQIQRPVRARLEEVIEELRRIVLSDYTPIEEVNEYLLLGRGKLFRPTLLLLSSEVGGRSRPEAVTLAATVELVHLAGLVREAAVGRSRLRRGRPTRSALWGLQTAIFMGDYLCSGCGCEMWRLGGVGWVRAFARAGRARCAGE